MSERKRFLLRIDPRLYSALEKWAADDLRSVNAQIEFLLSKAVHKAGRSMGPRDEPVAGTQGAHHEPGGGQG